MHIGLYIDGHKTIARLQAYRLNNRDRVQLHIWTIGLISHAECTIHV